MVFLRKKNCARTTINQVGGINASALSVVVADASKLPNSGDFLVTIWNKTSFPNDHLSSPSPTVAPEEVKTLLFPKLHVGSFCAIS